MDEEHDVYFFTNIECEPHSSVISYCSVGARHNPTGIYVKCDASKDPKVNKELAKAALRRMVDECLG